jgi:hypothetical protein
MVIRTGLGLFIDPAHVFGYLGGYGGFRALKIFFFFNFNN